MLLVDAAFTDVAGPAARLLVATPAVRCLAVWRCRCSVGCPARFDLVVGVLVAAAMLLVAPAGPRVASVDHRRRHGPQAVAGAPAAGLSSRPRRGGSDASWPFLVVGLVVAGACLVVAGWDRLVSPLVYQVDRGLQVESLSASPAMVGWLVHPSSWDMRLDFKAFEVFGPAVSGMLAVSTVLSVLLLAGLVAVWWRVLRQSATLAPGVWSGCRLASVSALPVSSKVFSPQYLLWLLPIAPRG